VLTIGIEAERYSLTSFFGNVFDPEKDYPAVALAGAI
jgi:hypothetical protein